MPEVLTRRGSVDSASNVLTFDASLSSEQPVMRWFGEEVLDHSPGAVDLSRAADGLPLLINHDQNQLVGRVDNLHLQARKLRGTLRFFDTQAGQDARALLEGGHREVSIGYQILNKVSEANGDTQRVRATRWALYEASIVAVPADPNVGVKRSADLPISRGTHSMDEIIEGAEQGAQNLSRSQRRAVQNASQEEIFRRDEIMGLARIAQRTPGNKITFDDAANAIAQNWSIERFRQHVLDNTPASRSLDTRSALDLAAPDGQYSIRRALAAQLDPHRFRSQAETEIEVSNRLQQRSELQHSGLSMPLDAVFPGLTRALSVGVAGSGGVMVGTITDQGPPIDVFRSTVVVAKLGARFLTGLVGNMQYPRKTATSSLGWTTETGSAVATGPTTDNISLTPKRLTAYVDVSKQLLVQTAQGAEQMILDDLRAAVGVLIDTVALRGSGAGNEPRGIANTSGIGSVVGGANGAQMNWGHCLGLESAVANVDASQASCAYVVNTKTRGWLKQQPKVSNQMPIWPDNAIAPDGIERLNGYRAGVTNILRSNLTKGTSSGVCSEVIFGSFDDLIIGIWGEGLDVTIDPYTLATTGQVRITVHLWMDVAVRRAQSFSLMSDALTV